MKSKSCVVCLCVYNNEKGLPKVFLNISRIEKIFKELTIVVFYDDSSDSSLELLDILKNNLKSDTIIIHNKEKKTNKRTENISNARNSLLQWIRNNKPDVEFFIMMDSNNYSCQGDIKPKILNKYIQDDYNDKWDALSFARVPYYDLWAFSDEEFQISCWVYPKNKLLDYITVYEYQQYIIKHIEKKILDKDNIDELIEVDSAFCGFCIYRTPIFINHKYSHIFSKENYDEDKLNKNLSKYPVLNMNIINTQPDCEHRNFHLSAKKYSNAKIIISKEEIFENTPP